MPDPSPSRPAGLSGDAGPTPEPRGLVNDEFVDLIASETAGVLVCMEAAPMLAREVLTHRAAVERVGQLEALVRWCWAELHIVNRDRYERRLQGDEERGALPAGSWAAVETLEKGTPDGS